MKILLSAFACEPGRGSEFDVGWHWALGLAELRHAVTVLTRSCSRLAIERALAALPATITRPRFVYFDLPPLLRWQARGPLHIHHLLWQRSAVGLAQRLNARERFDCVHHVTYAGLRAPSFMGKLGIPFILGPVGGGETAPWRLRYGYSLQGWLLDALRDAANTSVRFQPAITQTFARASRVYVTSNETLRLVPRRYRSKTAIELAVATRTVTAVGARTQPAVTVPDHPMGLRVLYAGRFADFKGMHLGLPAFAELLVSHPSARLSMVGDGPAKRHWRRLAERLGIAAQTDWMPWQRHEDMAEIYLQHDVFLFPTLHDSGGFVVLEAMTHGLPVVCLRLGGPSILVNDSCGRAVEIKGCSRRDVIHCLAAALVELADVSMRGSLSKGAQQRCREFSWDKKIERIYGLAS